jgi:hypothetical protein
MSEARGRNGKTATSKTKKDVAKISFPIPTPLSLSPSPSSRSLPSVAARLLHYNQDRPTRKPVLPTPSRFAARTSRIPEFPTASPRRALTAAPGAPPAIPEAEDPSCLGARSSLVIGAAGESRCPVGGNLGFRPCRPSRRAGVPACVAGARGDLGASEPWRGPGRPQLLRHGRGLAHDDGVRLRLRRGGRGRPRGQRRRFRVRERDLLVVRALDAWDTRDARGGPESGAGRRCGSEASTWVHGRERGDREEGGRARVPVRAHSYRGAGCRGGGRARVHRTAADPVWWGHGARRKLCHAALFGRERGDPYAFYLIYVYKWFVFSDFGMLVGLISPLVLFWVCLPFSRVWAALNFGCSDNLVQFGIQMNLWS